MQAIKDRINAAIAERESTISDWESRVYKRNRVKIEAREDDPYDSMPISIGALNEKRRARRLKQLHMEVRALRDVLGRMQSKTFVADYADKIAKWPNVNIPDWCEEPAEYFAKDWLTCDWLGLPIYHGPKSIGRYIWQVLDDELAKQEVASTEQDDTATEVTENDASDLLAMLMAPMFAELDKAKRDC